MFFLSGRAELFGFGVLSVPNRAIFVIGAGRHYCSHDGGDVEVGPGEHLLQDHIVVEVLLADLLDSPLHGDSALVMDGLGLVPVVVCLHQEPGLIRELVECVSVLGLSLDHHPLVGLDTSNNIVYRSSNPLIPQPQTSTLIRTLLLQHLPQQPTHRNRIILYQTHQILTQTSCTPRVHIYRKTPRPHPRQTEHTPRHRVVCKQVLPVFVVIQIHQQF